MKDYGVGISELSPISRRSYFNDRYEELRLLAEQAKKRGDLKDHAILHTRAMLAAKYLARSKR